MRSGTTKSTTDKFEAIDVRDLQRRGYLLPGCEFTISLNRNGAPSNTLDGYSSEKGYVVFPGGVAGDENPGVQVILLTWTSCNYGGKRPWFICPSCWRRRVAILYRVDSDFACRRCQELVYQSQRLRGDRRALRRALLIRIRLGCAPNVNSEFPPRPTGMHRHTYDRVLPLTNRAQMRRNPTQGRQGPGWVCIGLATLTTPRFRSRPLLAADLQVPQAGLACRRCE
jgi:hypothetical protein